MDKLIKLGDIPATTFLKFLKSEIKSTCRDNDKTNVSVIALTSILNALIDSCKEIQDNDAKKE